MMFNVYSVYDKKAMSYGPIMMFENDVQCIRNMEMTFSRGDSVVSRYPADFCVHQVGVFDNDNGNLVSCPIKNIYEIANAFNLEAVNKAQSRETNMMREFVSKFDTGELPKISDNFVIISLLNRKFFR